MIDIANQITLLRKEKGYTQETLAEMLNVSPQAISKWENGRSIPETSILPRLAKHLGCSIDNILIPAELQVLEAIYTDGDIKLNVTKKINKLADNDTLIINIGEPTFKKVNDNNRVWYLLLKYKTPSGIFYSYAKQGDELCIKANKKGIESYSNGLDIIDAYYGNSEAYSNVMNKIKHYKYFNWTNYNANHETFPSNPSTAKIEYLSIIYVNDTGINLVVCEESENIVYSSDKKNLFRELSVEDKRIIKGIEPLSFENKMDCTWAGALTVALKGMGRDTSYEEVMGVSGACYRIAFHPVWDYSSVDALVAYDYATPGYKAFGFKCVHAERVPKEFRESERNCIVRELNKNIPVLAINLRVAPEWGVITGYEEHGKTLLCRTYFDKEIIDREFLGNDRYLYVDNWPFIISHFEEEFTPPSAKDNLINSLKIMIDSNRKKEGRCGYAMGYEAYNQWCIALKNKKLFSESNNNDEDFFRRFDVNHYCLLALVDARRCAYEYLNESSKLFNDDKCTKLVELSNIFNEIYLIAERVYKKLLNIKKDSNKIKVIWNNELRNEQVDELQKILILEKKAEKKASKIVGILQQS